MTRLEEVERKQVELDALYAALVERAGDPAIDPMLLLLRVADQHIAEARRIALAADPEPQQLAWLSSGKRFD
ncbi:hypothetical protein H5J25_04190 [Sphingomonas aliaeris]|uniref:Uncharacterized protein n=1 Tax=Sphingomonas aliaeris TaxID=2759526 RepID=A0A974NW10_9SPHN|nr:hypothetical protein [Sphingomonas aliaeris]QQV77955.1 hypothetical protein H5J25_04190 [Sphingomonas aliaeris]